ncbi:MAG TPA: ATP-binding cassette domain-containing protein, partial [bacterium]|nr:ATP-binding cassette domain-containing protein [bacterium]
ELARALFGADPVDGGRIFIKGKPVRIGSPRDAIHQGIGYLTEDRKGQGLVLNLAVRENICLASLARFSRLGWVSRTRESNAASGFVDKLRIRTPGLGQQVRYLSGGNQQKVVMSKWLCSESRILLFDEPTRGIDVGAKVEIYQLMNKLAADGAAILMISSELAEIIGMSDRVLVMCQGRIAGELSAAEATQQKILNLALGGN